MPLENIIVLDVDLKEANYFYERKVTANDSITFVVNLTDDGLPVDLTNVTTISLANTRLDKTTVVTPGTKTGTNQVTFKLGQNETKTPGRVTAIVQLYDTAGRLSTLAFNYTVIKDPTGDGYIPPNSDKTLIQVVLGDGPLIISQAKYAADYAKTQADYAKSVADLNKMNYKAPVNTYADIAVTYPNPQFGDAVQAVDTGKFYRWEGSSWNYYSQITGNAITDIQNQLSAQNKKTETITHGMWILNTLKDIASTMKVEFYGNTLVNRLGKDGNLETLNKFNTLSANSSLDSSNVKYGNNSLKLDGTLDGSDGQYYRNEKLEAGKYYLFVSEIKNGTSIKGARIKLGSSFSNYYTDTSKFNVAYVKFAPTTTGDYELNHRVGGLGSAYFDGSRLYEISADTYNKIGVSLTDQQVADMFPYVDSVQHVKNPVLLSSGKNLSPTTPEYWESGVWQSTNGQSLATSTSLRTIGFIDVIPSTQYTIKTHVDYYPLLVEYDKNGNFITGYSYTQQTRIITTNANTRKVKLSLKRTDATNIGTDEILKAQLQLEVGGTATPYVPFNDSRLYAECTLAGNDNKKDILSYSETNRRWEKIKWWETDVVLDGSLAWSYSDNYTGYKRVRIMDYLPDNSINENSVLAQKYNGTILNRVSPANSNIDQVWIYQSTGFLYTTISNTESGWTESMTPSTDMIKAYFNGWKYTGDGTTHSWVSLVDGSAPATNTLAYVSTTMATGFTPYKLTYQLATPVIEPVTVEGDLVVSGATQVEVGNSVVVREKANPVKGTGTTSDNLPPTPTNKYYFINNLAVTTNGYQVPSGSEFKYKAEKIIGIYKNGELDTNWTITSISSANGKVRAFIHEDKFDATATYTVTYLPLIGELNSTNLTEVKATYDQSPRSALDSVITKQSDIATDQSILKRQMLDVLVRLDALEGV